MRWLILLFLVFGCTSEIGSGFIATTSYPVYDMTRSIVGEEIEVWLMLPPGLNAHSYEPTPQDIVKLENADAIIYTNDYFELWIHKTVGVVSNDIYVISASEKIPLIDTKGVKDPHTWLSPRKARVMAEHIADELIRKYPEKREVFKRNKEEYLAKLEELDSRYTEGTKNCRHREMFVSHAAFGYLAADYGLEQVAIIDNFEPEGEVSLADLDELIKEAKEKGATHIFFEEYISPKLSEAIANEIDGKTAVFSPIEAYSPQDQKSYIEVMDQNLVTMKEALDCE